MGIIGLDLHKRESQLCIRADDGALVERRIATTRERFAAVLAAHPQSTILLEASNESEWVARHLEALGHTVIVGDPNFGAMYATRSRHIKTDRRDARTLMEACAAGAYRPAYRASDARRHIRAELTVRTALVRTRTRYIQVAKTFVRRDGLRVPRSMSHLVGQRIAALPLSPTLAAEVRPLLRQLTPLNAEIAAADQRLEAIHAADPAMARLATVPAVGPVTASAFVAAVDDITRFRSAHQLEAYLGLVPAERSSGERRRLGHITKAGNPHVRWLLVEAAWGILRSRRPEVAALRAWALRIAARRGKRIAVVALARRLAGILFAMWRDETTYDPSKIQPPPTPLPEVAMRAS